MINKENIIKIKREFKGKRVGISIVIDQAKSNWLRENNYSPTAIFNEALKELGYVEGTNPTSDSQDQLD